MVAALIAVLIAALIAALLAGLACATDGSERATPATLEGYLAEVEAELEGGLADLDAGDREQLEDLFPVIASQVTWQGVLGLLDGPPAFLMLHRRMERAIERRADARIRREITTPFGNTRLRDLLVDTISEYLFPEAPATTAPEGFRR